MVKSADYWKERFENIEKASNAYGQDTYRKIEPAFEKAEKEIQTEIEKWYGRIAKNNNISIEEARKFLSSEELKEFKWDVKQYIKYGEENGLNQQWMRELENASAKYHISRLEALKLRTQHAAEVAFGNELDEIDKMARKVFSEDYYHSIYEVQKGFNLGWEIGQIDERKLEKIISKPWTTDNKTFKDRIWTSKNKMVSELHQQMTRMTVLGKAPDEAIKEMSKYVNKDFKNAKYVAGRLVMTEQAYFHSVAQQEAFNELDVEEFEVVATLDSHTSEICQEMDGLHKPMKEYEVGVTAPPFHVFCRSVTVPYFEDNYTGKRAARDEEGKTYYVPDDVTYKDWKKSMVDGKTKDLTNNVNSSIMNERGTKPITSITDDVIDKIPKVNIEGFTDEQNVFIQEQHKDLLRHSRDKNENKEVAFVFRKDLSDRFVVLGGDKDIDFTHVLPGKGDNLFVMHNHPSNSSFSDTDIATFISTDSIKHLSIVKNNGEIEILSKSKLFDKSKAFTEFKRQYKKYVKTGTDAEIDKAVIKFIERSKGDILWDKSK